MLSALCSFNHFLRRLYFCINPSMLRIAARQPALSRLSQPAASQLQTVGWRGKSERRDSINLYAQESNKSQFTVAVSFTLTLAMYSTPYFSCRSCPHQICDARNVTYHDRRRHSFLEEGRGRQVRTRGRLARDRTRAPCHIYYPLLLM